jgi:hypothetical protein
VRRLIITALFFEIGVVLVVVPWMPYWQQNFFIDARPYVEPLLTNPFVKGAISGLGLVNLMAGLAELASLFLMERGDPEREQFTPPANGRRSAASAGDLSRHEVSNGVVSPPLTEDRP